MVQTGADVLQGGSIKAVLEGHRPASLWVQLINAKAGTSGQSETPIIKASVSDSAGFVLAIFQGALAELFLSGGIAQYNVIEITNYGVISRSGRLLIVGKEINANTVIRETSRVGTPVPIDTTLPGAPAEAVSAPQPPANPFASAVGAPTPQPTATTVADGDVAIHEISTLSPYNNKWTIRARVTSKGDVRHYTNAKGEGKLFGVTFMDASGEIRATAFNEAVDRFYPLITEGQVYTLSGGTLRNAKRQFGGVRHDYEIYLNRESHLELVRGTDTAVPAMRFDAVRIADISALDKDATCDVIGIVRECGELSSITTRTTQKQLSKRDVVIEDASGASIRLTLWGAQAEAFAVPQGTHPVLGVRGAKVSDFNGCSLNASMGSQIVLNPDIPAAHELRGWFDADGVHATARPLSVAGNYEGGKDRDAARRTIAAITDGAASVTAEHPEYASLAATVTFVRSNDASKMWYLACPAEGCSRKVTPEGPGMYRCERCNTVHDRCEHRYVLSLQVADETGQMWLSAFNEAGELIMAGKKAAELAWLAENDSDAFREAVRAPIHRQFVFRVRGKRETYQGEDKMRYQVLSALPVDPVREAELIVARLGL